MKYRAIVEQRLSWIEEVEAEGLPEAGAAFHFENKLDPYPITSGELVGKRTVKRVYEVKPLPAPKEAK